MYVSRPIHASVVISFSFIIYYQLALTASNAIVAVVIWGEFKMKVELFS